MGGTTLSPSSLVSSANLPVSLHLLAIFTPVVVYYTDSPIPSVTCFFGGLALMVVGTLWKSPREIGVGKSRR